MPELFRKDAVEHQGQKLDGEVILATHMSFNVVTILILVIVVTGAAYLIWGEYHRKEVVAGYLRPTTGLSKVFTVAPGLMDEVYVKEGDVVTKGQILARLRKDKHLSSGAALNDAVIQDLIIQKNLVLDNLNNQQQLFIVNKEKLVSQVHNTNAQLLQTETQLGLLNERLMISEHKLSDIKNLIGKGFASEREYNDQRDIYLSLKQQNEDLQAKALSIRDQLSQFQYQTKQIPIQHDEQVTQLKSKLAGINQQITQTDAQRSFDIVSHRDGKVTSVLAQAGMMVTTSRPLMTILPADASLEAVLLDPTRAFGFVNKGQSTRIRYQAFPYQRFGIYLGEIIEVSKSVILPNETTLPVSIREPMYQVVVKLEKQGATAYGAEVALQAGMLLDADIMVDRRTLFEWLFEPIYSLRSTV